MLYLVSYTIVPERDVTSLLRELQNSEKWWHYLDDTWLLATKESSEQLWNRLAPNLLTTDRLLIMQVTQWASYFGWLPQDAWNWLNENRNY